MPKQYLADTGYCIVAFSDDDTYYDCAVTLAKSLKHFHPDAKVCLITNIDCEVDAVFDFCRKVEDLGGFNNDTWVYRLSPFHETIKLEADMLVAGPIDHRWTYLRNFEVWVSTGCRNFKGEVATSRYYRKIFDQNNLPDVYNAITYFKVSKTAVLFFRQIEHLMRNWSSVQKSLVSGSDQPLNTDLAYAIAIRMLGEEKFTSNVGPSIVHMKPKINDLPSYEWTNDLIWEIANQTDQTGV